MAHAGGGAGARCAVDILGKTWVLGIHFAQPLQNFIGTGIKVPRDEQLPALHQAVGSRAARLAAQGGEGGKNFVLALLDGGPSSAP